MSNTAALLLIILLSLADVILSLICLLHGNHLASFSQSVYSYTFQDSLFDLWLCAILRCTVLIGASIGTVSNGKDAVRRIRRCRPAVLTLFIFMIFLTLAKLLAYNEYHEGMRNPWLWGMFSWSLLASCLFYGQWTILGRTSRMPSQTPALHIQSEEDQQTLSTSSDCCDGQSTEEEEDEGQSKHSLLRLLAYSKPDLGFIAVAFIALVISSVAEIFQPLYIGNIIEGVVVLQDRSQFYHSILIMVSLAAVGAVAAGIRGIFFKVTMARLSFRINNVLFASIMKQEIGFFDTTRTGDITSRLTSDTATMSTTLSLNINVFLRNCVNLCGCVVLMVTLSWQLTIVSLAAIPVVAVVADYYGKYYEKLAEKVQDSLAKANSVAEEAISTMRTVRSFANEDREKHAYFKKLRVTFKLRCKEALVYGGFMLTNEFWDLVFIILTLLYGGHLVLIKAMSGGQLISFILYVEQLGGALEDIGNVYTGIMEASGASAQVFEFIDRQPKICNDGSLAPDDIKGRIEFNKVTFAYPSRPDINVLQDISFVVSPGEMVALVGPSGGGKTSCVNLIQHFYEPQLGDVLLDGIPVERFDHTFLHKTISMVGQEPVLYATSIKDNITYGMDDCDLHTIEDSATKANAHQFIIQQPQGYETQTGEKGIQLSGFSESERILRPNYNACGQKQRVAIARAFIRQPKVLLLDEATSALDAESEYEVQKALYREASKMTIVIIAHRLSTVEKADKIIVIDKGRVVEQGTHLQLVRAGGMYSELVHHQLLAIE